MKKTYTLELLIGITIFLLAYSFLPAQSLELDKSGNYLSIIEYNNQDTSVLKRDKVLYKALKHTTGAVPAKVSSNYFFLGSVYEVRYENKNYELVLIAEGGRDMDLYLVKTTQIAIIRQAILLDVYRRQTGHLPY